MALKADWADGDVYTAIAANAVAASVNTLSNRVVTPEDFGGVGDGATNDTVAINDMFDAVTAAGGGCIYIPGGKTYLSDTFWVPSNSYVFGQGTLKCRSDAGRPGPAPYTGAFAAFNLGTNNVTWVGPTLDINQKINVNGFDLGNADSDTESDYVRNIFIAARVVGSRIAVTSVGDIPSEDSNDRLFAGGGKGVAVGFRIRDVYINIRAEDCDIGVSVESSSNNDHPAKNVVIDAQTYNCHRCALHMSGEIVGAHGSLESASYDYANYPGVTVRLKANGGQDATVFDPVTNVEYQNYEMVGVACLNGCSGIDLQLDAAVSERATLVRGEAVASRIRVRALMDNLEDGWDTRYLPTNDPAWTFMSDNTFTADIHAATHSGVVIRAHRVSGSKSIIRSSFDVDMRCENGVGDITQSDGATDGFGTSVLYRFRDLRNSPVREMASHSLWNATPSWGSLSTIISSTALMGNFIDRRGQVVTEAGTTTLSYTDAPVQEFQGTTTQTVQLPSGGVLAGGRWTMVNNSTGTVTVQSSGANTITTVTTGTLKVFVAQVDSPTTAANWRAI